MQFSSCISDLLAKYWGEVPIADHVPKHSNRLCDDTDLIFLFQILILYRKKYSAYITFIFLIMKWKKNCFYVQRGHYCNTYVYIYICVFFLKNRFFVPSSLTVCFPEEALKQHTNLLSWVKHNLSLISYFIPLLIPVLFTFNLVLITGSILP